MMQTLHEMTVALSLQFGGLCMESSHACSYLCVWGAESF